MEYGPQELVLIALHVYLITGFFTGVFVIFMDKATSIYDIITAMCFTTIIGVFGPLILALNCPQNLGQDFKESLEFWTKTGKYYD